MKIIDLLKNSAKTQPQKIALKSDNFEISYKELFAETFRLAKQLKKAGCSKGVKVAITLGNSIEYFISFFSISAADGIILPLSTRMTPFEVARYVSNTDVSILVTNKAYGIRLLNTLKNKDEITIIYIKYNSNRKLDIVFNSIHDCKIDEENKDVALFMQTSGTTGLPKVVMLTDNNLISNMSAYRTTMNFKKHNTVFCALPLHHIYCICTQILTHISLADTFVINDNPFFIKDFLTAVEKNNITITAFVPYMGVLLADYPSPEDFNLSSLKYVTFSGAKTSKVTYNLLSEKYKTIHFINSYGMSEAGSKISASAPFATRFPVDSVGHPISGVKVRIADENGNSVAVNTPGEILVKSSGVMKGYYKQPDLTKQTIVDGWLKTADLGKLDENGNLYILGRLKDIIITGGENFYPGEVEEHLISHPAIREVVVVGQKHKLFQEVPFAFIVKNENSDPLTRSDIIKYCKGRLSNNKIPQAIKVLERFPKLSTTKIDRQSLKKMADELC